MGIPEIIFEDESLMVINKPSGWITNDATTTSNQPTVQGWLSRNLQFTMNNLLHSNNLQFRNGIVHRLDKETSGILVIAKTKEVFEELQRQFKERKVKKSYIALVHGKLDGEGDIVALVGRLPWRRDRFGVLPGGRESETHYKVLEFYKGDNAGHTLVEFFPKTGRTHQIRIHAKHMGHAIVADEFYAGRKTARNDRKWCPRLFLHASSIKFTHPTTGKVVEFKSSLPKELRDVLELV
ncbi:MAG: RluA family pseudouridine synthase [Patescibacteria group bacterium]